MNEKYSLNFSFEPYPEFMYDTKNLKRFNKHKNEIKEEVYQLLYKGNKVFIQDFYNILKKYNLYNSIKYDKNYNLIENNIFANKNIIQDWDNGYRYFQFNKKYLRKLKLESLDNTENIRSAKL